MSSGMYEYRKTKKRKQIFESAIDRIGQLISQTSDSQAIDRSVKLGTRYIDRMREVKNERYTDIQEQIKELEEEKRQLEERWETEEIKFEDI
jgi:3-deoxy-D-manno-octulosonic-acid transferase